MMVAHEEHEEKVSLSDLIPVQSGDPVSARLRTSGECQLLWAILEDAVHCYLHYAKNPSAQAQHQFHEAAEWIESEEEDWLCSFISICRAFQIDPHYLRQGLRRCLEARLREPADAPLRRAA